MGISRDEVFTAYDALDAAIDTIAGLEVDTLSAADKIAVAHRLETIARKTPAVEHRLLSSLMAETEPTTLGAKSWAEVLKIALRMSGSQARRRVRDAEMLGPRQSLAGEPLAPVWEHTAAAQAAGRIGTDHVATIAKFFTALPHWVDIGTRVEAEAHLAALACGLDPDQLAKAAQRLLITIDPDGPVPDEREQTRRRGLRVGPQQRDGMSKISGYLTPTARAYWEAVSAKLAAPGVNPPGGQNPDRDHTPDGDVPDRGHTPGDEEPDRCEADTPSTGGDRGSAEQRGSDPRSPAQRDHDAFLGLCRDTMASGRLGHHNGLPATVIVTTTLQDLEHAARQAAKEQCKGPDHKGPDYKGPDYKGDCHDRDCQSGDCENRDDGAHSAEHGTHSAQERRPAEHALTAGGTLVPMREVIRMATRGYPYLAVFDGHTNQALYLGRAKRLATPAQRLMLLARDRGCTRPGCTTGGYWTQIHHIIEWAHGGATDITNLTLACGPDNRAATTGGWNTRTRQDGRTQ